MGAFPRMDASQTIQWPPNPKPSPPDSSDLQTLLFNIMSIVLAAATLLVACLHFAHQRRADSASLRKQGIIRKPRSVSLYGDANMVI